VSERTGNAPARDAGAADAPSGTPVVMIESLDAQGRGVAHYEGKALFVEGALPGERVEFAATKRKPRYEQGRIGRLLGESAGRVAPRCMFFGVCGGCSMQHAALPLQIAAKQRVLEDALWHVGRVKPDTVLAPLQGPSWGYRHRARLSVRLVPKKGGVLVGFHERRSSYVADMTSCEVLPPHVSRLLPELRVLVQATSIANRLPQIEVSVGARATVLVFRILQPLTPADEALLRRFAEQHGVQVWLQTAGPESAQPFHPLDGPALDYVLDDFGVRIAFLPTDFTQVNHAINAVLVRRALRLLAPQRGERVLDLFCGLGNFALPAAALGARVTGYEGNAGLARRAQENAARNGLAAEFGVANLFEPTQVPSLSTAHKLIIDPPREGAVEVVKAVDPQAAPERIVYVSCDPATLARDAGILVSQKGYRLAAAGIANMFPHTAHVESIALFTRE
jgi:23S rRNA (uracil1939-C5)-methyltransferase